MSEKFKAIVLNQSGDKFSREVSNGVYFCRLTLGGKVYWTKLMVVHS